MMHRSFRGGRGCPIASLAAFLPLFGLLVLAIALAGCATAPPPNPFQVSEVLFRTQVKRIALAPIAVPPQLGVAETAKLRLDSLIEAKLQEAGFITFSAKSWGDALTRMKNEVGGILNPRTGGLDEAKMKAAWAKTAEDIRGQFQFDAVLLPRVHIVKADWRGAGATWDGVSEALAPGFVLIGNVSGTLPALSLVVSIGGADLEAPAQYRHRAGIQVLEKLSPLTDRLSGKMFTAVPNADLLTNDERNRGAIEIVFGPLMKKP